MHESIEAQAELGAHRRELLAQLVRKGLPGTDRRAGGRGRYVRRAYREPEPTDAQSDAELRDRIHARLGRLVSHPGAIQFQVTDGVVRLTGRVLCKEREGLLEQLRQMAGVRNVVDAMTAHDYPQEIASRGAIAVPLAAPTR